MRNPYLALAPTLALLATLATLGIGAACAAETAPVEFAGARLKLPIPAGFCYLPPESPGGQSYYGTQQRAMGPSAKVAAIFVDCAQQKAAVPVYTQGEPYGMYLLPMENGNPSLRPATLTRRDFIGREQDKLRREIQQLPPKGKADAAGPNFSLNTPDITPPQADAAGMYFAMTTKANSPTATKAYQVETATTLVRRVHVELSFYNQSGSTEERMQRLKATTRAMVEGNP